MDSYCRPYEIVTGGLRKKTAAAVLPLKASAQGWMASIRRRSARQSKHPAESLSILNQLDFCKRERIDRVNAVFGK
jgi:hypothetical protein